MIQKTSSSSVSMHRKRKLLYEKIIIIIDCTSSSKYHHDTKTTAFWTMLPLSVAGLTLISVRSRIVTMAHHAFQQFSSAAPPLHSLPPGCKYLSCREARDVLQTCPTYRLADGSIVAPVGGELYQVLEIPTNCDERCLASHRVSHI